MLAEAALGDLPLAALLNGGERLLGVSQSIHHDSLAKLVVMTVLHRWEELLNLFENVCLERIQGPLFRGHSVLDLRSMIILILHLLQEGADLVRPPLEWPLRDILQELLVINHTLRR